MPSVRNDNSHGLWPPDVQLVVFGPPRSGTTWVSQVCRDVLGPWVVQTHCWLDLPGTPVLAVIRDPRDCVISHWRFRHPEEVEQFGTITKERIINLSAFHAQEAWLLEQWRQSSTTVTLRYEDVKPNPSIVFDALQTMLCIAVEPPARQQILEARSMDANRRALEPGHVHEGEHGTWRQFVNADSGPLLCRLLRPLLLQYGYEE